MEEKDKTDERHDDRLLEQRVGQGLDRALDQTRAVVGHRNLDVVERVVSIIQGG